MYAANGYPIMVRPATTCENRTGVHERSDVCKHFLCHVDTRPVEICERCILREFRASDSDLPFGAQETFQIHGMSRQEFELHFLPFRAREPVAYYEYKDATEDTTEAPSTCAAVVAWGILFALGFYLQHKHPMHH